jgi:hypothetical protein
MEVFFHGYFDERGGSRWRLTMTDGLALNHHMSSFVHGGKAHDSHILVLLYATLPSPTYPERRSPQPLAHSPSEDFV